MGFTLSCPHRRSCYVCGNLCTRLHRVKIYRRADARQRAHLCSRGCQKRFRRYRCKLCLHVDRQLGSVAGCPHSYCLSWSEDNLDGGCQSLVVGVSSYQQLAIRGSTLSFEQSVEFPR